MFSHHDARYNLEITAQELLLIQDHYTAERCADCILKHLMHIKALTEEARHLDNYEQVKNLVEKAHELALKHIKIVVTHVNKEAPLGQMIQEVRELRKEILQALFGIGGVEHEHEH